MIKHPLIFHHDNNTTTEFDSGISYQGIEGKITIELVLCILGGAII